MNDHRPIDSLPPLARIHTHTVVKQGNETQHSRMQGKQKNLEYFGSQECKQKQKSAHTAQIIQQKDP